MSLNLNSNIFCKRKNEKINYDEKGFGNKVKVQKLK